ncbi:MAG: peptidase dimerization domain-containing protein [Lachnospira eligens]
MRNHACKCAGCSAQVKLRLNRTEMTGTKLRISISGLTGGHSGVEIDKGRGNANVLMSRILRDAAEKHQYLLYLLMEEKDNAIPRECLSEIIVEADKAEAVKAAVEETQMR